MSAESEPNPGETPAGSPESRSADARVSTGASGVALSEFPEPVQPPGDVHSARDARLAETQRVALLGIGIRTAVIGFEGLALWWWQYAALLTDLVASVLDVVSSIAIVLAIRSAARPPDDNHPFGHGRIEPLAGLQMGILLVLAGAGLAVRYLFGMTQSEAAGWVSPLAWTVPAAAAVALEAAARMVRRTAEAEQSTALLAEAGHYRIDAFTSLFAAAGLGLAATAPHFGHHVDLLSATGLAVIMVLLGVAAVRENVHQLLDHVPHDDRFERVRDAARGVEGVQDVEKLRIQQAGPDAHVDIDIEVDPSLSVAEAHVISQHVRAAIQAAWPFVQEVVVHVEPFYEGDH